MATSQYLSITGEPLPLDTLDSFQGSCQLLSQFEILNPLGEGSFGLVARAIDKRTSNVVALKQIRTSESDSEDGGNRISSAALRELGILQFLKHDNIVDVLGVAVDVPSVIAYESEKSTKPACDESKAASRITPDCYMIMEHSGMIGKCITRQLLQGVEYLHENAITHRDLKPENILLSPTGSLKIADYSLSRPYLHHPKTPGVATLWYRAPKLLLGTRNYTTSVDLWSIGCNVYEVLRGTPAFAPTSRSPHGTSPEDEAAQLASIVSLVGRPTKHEIADLRRIGCPSGFSHVLDIPLSGENPLSEDMSPSSEVPHLKEHFQAIDSSPPSYHASYLRCLRDWSPYRRYTARDALSHRGLEDTTGPVEVEDWWKFGDAGCSREELGRGLRRSAEEMRRVICEGVIYEQMRKTGDGEESQRQMKKRRRE